MVSSPKLLVLLLSLLLAPLVRADDLSSIEATLDGFHQAATEADYQRYSSLMTEDIVFLGTDATERWQGQAFSDFARPHFDSGKGWEYRPRDRRVTLAPGGDVAWFDELLDHDKLGTCRGSGVVVREAGEWKVAQYNLSVPVPNDLVYGVADRIKAYDAGEDIAPIPAAPVAEEPEASAEEPREKCRERRHKTNRKASC